VDALHFSPSRYRSRIALELQPGAQAVGVESTGDGSDIPGHPQVSALDWEEFSRDLLLARRWCDDLLIYNLEGCVQQGFLARIRSFDWNQVSNSSTAGNSVARGKPTCYPKRSAVGQRAPVACVERNGWVDLVRVTMAAHMAVCILDHPASSPTRYRHTDRLGRDVIYRCRTSS
jgi:hypothetical protein